MSSLAVFSLAAFDFYSDIFFAHSAFQSDRSTVSTLGIVMIGWLVVVFAVNGWLLVQVKRKHELATNKENGRPFDEQKRFQPQGGLLGQNFLRRVVVNSVGQSPKSICNRRRGHRRYREFDRSAFVSSRRCRPAAEPAGTRGPDQADLGRPAAPAADRQPRGDASCPRSDDAQRGGG